MITRKLGSILRGKATPFQLVAASVLGTLLGFAPGFLQAPALYAILLAALLLLNANLGVALLAAGLMRVVALLALPLSFQIGRFLLDGPTSGLARALVNAPVLAWCGLERYAVAGGLALGLALGLACGFLLARAVTAFRRRMAASDPTQASALLAKPWARFAMWFFFAGTGGRTWEEKLARSVGNPVRIWGAALIVLVLAGGWLAQRALAGPLVRRGLQAGLEEANGATVDVGTVVFDLREGRFAVAGLALADANDLRRDLFRADRLEADLDQADLLRRRARFARLVVSEARSGTPRELPGERVVPLTAEVVEEAGEAIPDPRDLTLEQVLQGYETWKSRLAQARRWLDLLSGALTKEEEASAETFAERLEREAREKGWFSVRAGHVVEEAPTLRISELVVEGLQTTWLPGKTLDLRGNELSTHPGLVDAPPRLSLASRDGTVCFDVDLAPVSRGGGAGGVKVVWKGLSVDEAMSRLKLPGPPPLRGGTLDLEIDGAWSQARIGWVDLPLRVTIRDSLLAIEGIEPTKLESLALPIEIRGPIDAPRVRFDRATFADALAKAGKDEVARRVRERLEGEVGGKLEELRDTASEEAKGLLKGILEKTKKKDG